MTNFTQADLDLAVRTERHRHQIVLNSTAIRGREAAAFHMLASTDLASAEIISALSGLAAAGQPQHLPSSDAQEGQGDFQRGQQIASSLPQALRK